MGLRQDKSNILLPIPKILILTEVTSRIYIQARIGLMVSVKATRSRHSSLRNIISVEGIMRKVHKLGYEGANCQHCLSR